MATLHGWYRPSHVQTVVTLRSHLHSLHQHWISQIGKNVKCIGEHCELCDAGYPIKYNSAACVQHECGGRLQLLEFTDAHGEIVNALDNFQQHVIGQQLKVQRIEHKSVIELRYELAGRVDAKHIYCHKYISAIGLRDYALVVNDIIARRPELRLQA